MNLNAVGIASSNLSKTLEFYKLLGFKSLLGSYSPLLAAISFVIPAGAGTQAKYSF